MLLALGMEVPAKELVGIVNVGDDLTLHGLRICPDLDTITYTLAGLNNTETGWGLTGETWRVMQELDLLGGESWFSLGDRDLATHLFRTQRLADGATLTEVTRALLDHHGVPTTLLPATEDEVATTFTTAEHGTLSFQEYFVRHHHGVPVESVAFVGADTARPGPHVLDVLSDADRIVISPSNPLISIAPILAIPGIADVLRRRRDDVVAVSPLIGGRAVKGPADRLLDEIGPGATAEGIARSYVDLASTLIIDSADAAWTTAVEEVGMRCLVTETLMDRPERSATLAQVVLHG